MSRVTLMQTSFNGGELSDFMLGRPDHAMWPISLAEMVGFAPRPQGPAEACPGFLHVEMAPGPCRLIAFEPETTQGYVIEASDELLRFYTNDVLLRDGDDAPVTVAAPWTYDQVRALDVEPSVDVAYMFHLEVRTRLLERVAADEFALSDVEFLNGPFLDRNTDESLTLSFSGVTGSVTATASAPLFAATDVGRLIEIEAHDLSDIPSWEPGLTVSLGDLRQWDGRVYQALGGGSPLRTGSAAPLHTRGVEWDGAGSGTDLNDNTAGGVQWAYMHDMFGRLKITGFTSAVQVTATVTRTLPLQVAEIGEGGYTIGDYLPSWYEPPGGYVGSGYWEAPGDAGTYTPGTWRWRLGAFSDTTGWPSGGVVWNQRLFLRWRNKVFYSTAADLLDFDRLNELGDLSVDMAGTETLSDSNDVRWLHAGDELFLGTGKVEYVLRAASAAQPFGPGNTKLARQTRHGAAAGLRPVDLNARPVFLQKNGRKLLELVEGSFGRYEAEDLTRYADHMGNSAFVEMCWQREPLALLWAVRADGSLACADYMPKEQVLGWFRRPLASGLAARSICAVTDPTGRYEQLWCVAQKGGQWLVMQLGPWRLAGEQQDLPVMLDAALTYSGAAEDTFAMPHLAGESVDVVGDGVWLGSFAVAGDGALVLDAPVESAVAGLTFPAYLVPLPPEAGGDNGPAQMKMKRSSRIGLRVQNTLGLRVTCPGGVVTDIGNTTPATDLVSPVPPITRDVLLDPVGTWDRAGQLRIDRVAPFPATILALVEPALDVSQR
jgi:hypothetical protein